MQESRAIKAERSKTRSKETFQNVVLHQLFNSRAISNLSIQRIFHFCLFQFHGGWLQSRRQGRVCCRMNQKSHHEKLKIQAHLWARYVAPIPRLLGDWRVFWRWFLALRRWSFCAGDNEVRVVWFVSTDAAKTFRMSLVSMTSVHNNGL